MVRRSDSIGSWLFGGSLLGSSLLACGCTNLADSRLPAQERTAAKQTAALMPKPSMPASVLHIPGPPSAPVQSSTGAPLQLTLALPQEPPPTPVLPALEPAKAVQQFAVNAVSPLRDLAEKAARKHASIDSYMLRLRRREMVGNHKMPEEVLLLKYRQQPMSVFLKWLGTEGKGREVVYVQGHYGDKLHVRLASGDFLLMPAGKRMAFAPDSLLVRDKSRYPITEAGLGPLVVRFGKLVDAVEKGDMSQGSAKYLGQLKRPEFDDKLEGVLQTMPAKSDPLLPRGGQRLWFFDPTLHLPVLVITQDDTGREVEYYCHDRIQFPIGLDDADFNPDVLWKAGS